MTYESYAKWPEMWRHMWLIFDNSILVYKCQVQYKDYTLAESWIINDMSGKSNLNAFCNFGEVFGYLLNKFEFGLCLCSGKSV